MQVKLYGTSRLNYAITKQAIGKTCRKLRRDSKKSQKEAAKLLDITTYSLSHYEGLLIMSPDLLTRALKLYNSSYDEFINTACEYISLDREFHYINKSTKIKSVSDNDVDIFTPLYNDIKDTWERTTDISVEILDQWIYDTCIYYIYFILIKKRFIKNEQYEFVKKRKLKKIDLWFIAYYDTSLDSLLEIKNIPIWILNNEKENSKQKEKRERLEYLKSLIR